jgi:hypothetical protein
VLLVFDINFDLILLFGVRDGEARANFDFGAIFGAGADEGTDYAGRLSIFSRVSSDSVVEDGEDGLWRGGKNAGLTRQSCVKGAGPDQDSMPRIDSLLPAMEIETKECPGPAGGAKTYLRLDVDGKRGNARLKPSSGVRQGTREMYEALGSGGSHTGQDLCRDEAVFVRSRMRYAVEGTGG